MIKVLVLKIATRAEHMRSVRRLKFSGGKSCGVTPVPIPNTEVKSATPKILGWRRPGKIGTARIIKAFEKSRAFFFAYFLWGGHQSGGFAILLFRCLLARYFLMKTNPFFI